MNANNDEGKLISGKEALIALANGEKVEWCNSTPWYPLAINTAKICYFLELGHGWLFRLAPRTITINGIEVPAPFKPKEDVIVWILNDSKIGGYQKYDYEVEGDDCHTFIGAWRTEEEIKQVVAALRQVFGGAV
ncbi:hypothetical protein [Acinetobacter radioresistens]|uniref:hypothetical protein n=1 Tax=Acinetobacter radioresistens TaxID=40216 RepID=UPI003212B4CC